MMNKDTIKKAIDMAGRAGEKAAWRIAGKGGEYAGRAAIYIYDNRQQIRDGAEAAAEGLKATVRSGFTCVYDIAGVKLVSQKEIDEMIVKIEEQGNEYRRLTDERRKEYGAQDSIAVGGDLVADIVAGKAGVSEDVVSAYEAAYPGMAAEMSFAEAVEMHDGAGMAGFVSGVKGKLFEMRYAEHLNEGNLPKGYEAYLAGSTTQPGWDVAIKGPDGELASQLQVKATDSVGYVRAAIEKYPDVDVVTTDEVYSRLVMNGAAEGVLNSGITDVSLTDDVLVAADNTLIHMDWGPPVISMALIAFSSFREDDLQLKEKAANFGSRFGKSYVACLIGGGVVATTQLWWLGLLAGVGSRYMAERGRVKREVYDRLKKTIEMNQAIINGMKKAPAV